MSAVFGNSTAAPGEVNDFHVNSDVDKSTLSQHHTLGILPNQASPGDHIHDGKTSRRIRLSDLAGDAVEYQPMGGTNGTQPTFSGDPLISGHYSRLGGLCYFSVEVDFDNITSFGTGQYYVTIPFASHHQVAVTAGILFDDSTGDQYSISGVVAAGSTQLNLFSVASNGRVIPFADGTPVNLATADNFLISGVYHVVD